MYRNMWFWIVGNIKALEHQGKIKAQTILPSWCCICNRDEPIDKLLLHYSLIVMAFSYLVGGLLIWLFHTNAKTFSADVTSDLCDRKEVQDLEVSFMFSVVEWISIIIVSQNQILVTVRIIATNWSTILPDTAHCMNYAMMLEVFRRHYDKHFSWVNVTSIYRINFLIQNHSYDNSSLTISFLNMKIYCNELTSFPIVCALHYRHHKKFQHPRVSVPI